MSTDVLTTEHETQSTIAPKASATVPDTHDNLRKPQVRVAYIMSRFPKLTETFVLFEMLAVESQGAHVEVFPLLRARNSTTHPEGAGPWRKLLELFRQPDVNTVMHPEAKAYVERAHFVPLFSWAIFVANLFFALRHPVRYFGALGTLTWANLGSVNYLLGGLILFPKTVFFARTMEQLRITHIHAHFANHPAAAAYVIHRLTGIPYSFTAHGADLQVDQHMLREKVAAAKYAITISNDNFQLIKRVCGEASASRVRIVRCGVDTRIFQSSPDDQAAHQPACLNILCTGTLYEVKGHRYLIDACRILRERHVPFLCQLVGDGPLLSELKDQVATAHLEDHVHFLGRQTRQQIANLLKRADVVVAPSVPTNEGRREGIPVVLMEAMASGVPVVASNISGIPELVEHERTGLLVPPRDAEALGDAIQRLGSDEQERRQFGQAARRKVLAEFDVERNAAQLLELFREGAKQ